MLWLGVLLATFSLVARVRQEATPSPVEIALEWGDATRLSAANKVSLGQWLRAMRQRGARGVTLDVKSVRDLSDDGRLTLWSRASAAPFFPQVARLPQPYKFVIVCRDKALFNRIRAWLRVQSVANPVLDVAPDVIAVALSPASLSAWPVGLDPSAITEIKRAKMEPLARLGDWTGANPMRLNAVLKQVRSDGARIVVVGDPSPGNQTLLPETARAMRKTGLSFAWVEADTARGTPELARHVEGYLVRAHAVSALDTQRLEPGEIVDRFARAARERNVRLFLVRMPRQLTGEATEEGQWKRGSFSQQLDFMTSLASETRENHWARLGRSTLSIGLAHRFGVGTRSPKGAALARFGAGIGTVGATLLVIALFMPLSLRATRSLAIVGIAGVAALSPFPGFGAQLLALQASLVFPVIAFAWSGANAHLRKETRRNATLRASRVLLLATGLAVAGGLVVAATLNDWTYWSKVADFWGTKAASLFPIALVLLVLLGDFWPGNSPAHGWKRVRRRLRVLGRRAFPLRDVLLAACAFLVVGLWLARSGNDSGVAVSDYEWKFRALLETLFVARPRTKEFLLCHPALIVGALCAFRCQRHLAWPLLLLGAIGQINVVNSFAQANNPLYVPLWRTILSLALGGIFGASLSWLVALRLGYKRDTRRWRGWLLVRRIALVTTPLLVIFSGGRWFVLRSRYAALVAPSQNTNWPWPGAKPETLYRGVSHWTSTLRDGTTLDLLLFDWKANPRLRLGIWDADLESSPDKKRPLNRFPYWNNGFASQAAKMNARGNLIAAWNAGFFGLLNEKPRANDRAFHLSPVVVRGRAFYRGANHRWTWGAQTRGGLPPFKLEHEPNFAHLGRDFDSAAGTLQALMINGKPLELRAYPWFGEKPQTPPIPSTPSEAGHIPTLDWMHTSRTSAGWNKSGQLWVLIVKEPDGEEPSRALVGRRERGRGGWTLADEQRFWLSMRDQKGVENAIGFDGGDVAQATWRQPNENFQVLAPRIAIPYPQKATLRLQTDSEFQSASVRALHGSSLSYFMVREATAP
ncbi:hypothetical protein IAD21_01947 [Abditibacteriota bacterium]|nr:hypothetical protein IAD21_01947 [Abditibacteriota bacterium]